MDRKDYIPGIVGLTALICMIFYPSFKERFEEKIHDTLPIYIRSYDLNKDGDLQKSELDALLKDYHLEKNTNYSKSK